MMMGTLAPDLSFPGVLTLGQIPTPITVPPLPSAPLLERWILEDAWAPGTVLALGAALAAFILLRRQEPARALLVSGILAAAAAAVLLAGWLVETGRETMIRETHDMVFAVAGADRARLTALLDPDAQLVSSPAGEADGRDAIIAKVDGYAQVRGMVTEHAVLEVQASQDGPQTGRVQVLVRVWAGGVPVFSWWRLDFRRSSDNLWTCRRIEELWDSSRGERGR